MSKTTYEIARESLPGHIYVPKHAYDVELEVWAQDKLGMLAATDYGHIDPSEPTVLETAVRSALHYALGAYIVFLTKLPPQRTPDTQPTFELPELAAVEPTTA